MSASDEGDWVRVIASEKVEEGRLALAFLGTRRLAFMRLDGVVHAFNNSCPHAASPLSGGLLRNGTVTCGRHGWVFDVRSGACHTNPAYRLRRYATREVDGWVEVEEPREIW